MFWFVTPRPKTSLFQLLAIHLSRRHSKTKLEEEEKQEEDETSTELISLALLFAFLMYIVAGSLFLPLLNGEFDFLNGIYYNFLVLTAIDFGALVPTRVEFLPITFLYVCVGLAIVSLKIQRSIKNHIFRLHWQSKLARRTSKSCTIWVRTWKTWHSRRYGLAENSKLPELLKNAINVKIYNLNTANK